MTTRRIIGGFAALAIFFGAVVTAAPVSQASSPSIMPTVQDFFWEWSDGVDSKVRTFRKSEYKIPENLPQLLVTAEPATPQQFVKLQFKQDGKWRREDGAATNSKGVAALSFNPYCEDGKWCEGTFKYRLIVNGNYTVFTINYE